MEIDTVVYVDLAVFFKDSANSAFVMVVVLSSSGLKNLDAVGCFDTLLTLIYLKA